MTFTAHSSRGQLGVLTPFICDSWGMDDGHLGTPGPTLRMAVTTVRDPVDRPRASKQQLICGDVRLSTIHRPYYSSYQKLEFLRTREEVLRP